MIIEILYLVAAVLFILGIKNLTKVKTALRGNRLSSLAMFIAIIATLWKMDMAGAGIGWQYIIGGIVVGSFIGSLLAKKVKMTAMPQLVAVFNGFGGGASAIVAISYFLNALIEGNSLLQVDLFTVILSIVIGTITFTGSLIAFGKLQGFVNSKPMLFFGRHFVNFILFALVIYVSYILIVGGTLGSVLIFLVALVLGTGLLGILLVTSIGGADMPVVISLLNSYSGIAASATGFVLNNNLLIIAGALVGASGLILTSIMCKAMNRSLFNVIFGGFGGVVESEKKESSYKNIRGVGPEETALMFENAKKVIVIPGYGMAVAQAQHAVQELSELLEKRGCVVKFAIHPVAGRMPGHMNVLLAEADVPYDKLFELENINSDFNDTDVVLVIGANDVVNPAATKDKSSPIYGMPILNAHKAKTCVVVKRSLSPGFAGIDNELFDYDNTLMLFGDAKQMLIELIKNIEEL